MMDMAGGTVSPVVTPGSLRRSPLGAQFGVAPAKLLARHHSAFLGSARGSTAPTHKARSPQMRSPSSTGSVLSTFTTFVKILF